jgi:hypothetical protein
MNNRTVHKLLALFFGVLFVVNILLPSLIFTHFKINQEFIAANLCVEKEIEESTCNGKCQLKKSLAVVEVTKPQKENFELTIESHITSIYLEPIEILCFSIGQEPEKHNNQLIQLSSEGFYPSLFRPPILS